MSNPLAFIPGGLLIVCYPVFKSALIHLLIKILFYKTAIVLPRINLKLVDNKPPYSITLQNSLFLLLFLAAFAGIMIFLCLKSSYPGFNKLNL